MFIKTSQIREKHCIQAILLAMALGVLTFFPLTGVTFTLPKLTVLSIAAVVMCLWLLLYAEVNPLSILWKSGWLGWSLLLFVLSILFSVCISVMPVFSILGAGPRIEGLLTHAVYATAFCFALCIGQKKEGRAWLRTTVLWTNAIVVFYGAIQFLGLDPLQQYWNNDAFLHRVFSLLGHPNALGAFIILTMPIVCLCLLQSEKRVRAYYLCLLTLNAIVLMATASRSAILGLLGLIAACIILLPEFSKKIRTANVFHKAIITWVLLGVFVIGYVSYLHRFSIEGEQTRSVHSRQIIWSDILHLAQERPQGYGLETLGTLYPSVKSSALLRTESIRSGVDRAHNTPLDLLVTLGPIGMLSFYVFLFFLLKAAVQRKEKEHELFACALGIFGFSIAMLFGFHTPATATFFWLIVGWMMSIVWQKMRPRPSCGQWVRVPILLLCGTVLCANAVFLRWSLQRVHLAQAEAYFGQGALTESLGSFETALQTFPYDRTLLVRFAETALFSAEHAPDAISKEVFISIAQQSIARLSLLTNGHDGMVPLLQAWAAAVQGDAASVRGYTSEAKVMMPTTIDTYRITAHSFRLVGDIVAALQAEYELTQLLPSYWQDKTGRGRILWKENPWLQDLTNK